MLGRWLPSLREHARARHVPLGITYAALPATIELSIIREARIEAPSGQTVTGSVGVDVRATLQAVLIRAAD